MKNHSIYILIISLLLIILLFKLYLESNINNKYLNNQNSKSNNEFDYPDSYNNKYTKNNHKFEKMLEDANKETIRKINKAVEQGYIEGFQAMNVEIKENMDDAANINEFYKYEITDNDNDNDSGSSKNNNYNSISNIKSKNHNKSKNNSSNDNIISYLNKGNSEKIMLFYKPSCPYCSDFMPIWYKIVNNLSNNVLYEEINCEKEYKKANEYQITSVPTIILLVNNEKKMYMGDRNYKDIMQFLKYNGINLIERTFEEFDSTGYSNDSNTIPNKNTSVCQSVTFNTATDIAQDQYMFQIFNSDGQYGYAEGGYNPEKIMSPFTAAYSTIDSYLTSLPEGANIRDCANMYADQIRSFGLCDKKQLDNILQYQKDVSQGSATTLIDGTDYSSNNDVVMAIKKVCNL